MECVDRSQRGPPVDQLVPTFQALEVRKDLTGDGPETFSGFPFDTKTDTVAIMEATAEAGMALALANGRSSVDPLPMARRWLSC